MSIRQHVLGEVAIRSGLNVSGADIEGLLRRLLLFESVTIKSVRLRELPYLVRAFGKDGFLQLVASDVLKISCEISGIISPLAKNGVRALPFCHFSFGKYEIENREAFLRSELRALQGVPGLKNVDRETVEGIVLAKLVRPPSEYMQKVLDQLETDLRTGTPALRIATNERIKNRFGIAAAPVDVTVEEVEKRTFRVISDIPKIFRISEQDTHDILNQAVSAVGHINHRIAEMEAYSAITGFAESDASLLFGKLAGIIKPFNPRTAEEQFGRVATILDFPELVPGKRVDVERLLAARESPELAEFRDWLSKLEELSDDQIRDMLGGIRNRLGFLIRGGAGKTIRLAATTVVGLINPIVGIAAGALDTFVLERVLPSSGVFAFLTKTYPSLFVSH
ncbi:MAG: hypothetical protein WA817_00405 [Candidatus Acidiferrum sp.]